MAEREKTEKEKSDRYDELKTYVESRISKLEEDLLTEDDELKQMELDMSRQIQKNIKR